MDVVLFYAIALFVIGILGHFKNTVRPFRYKNAKWPSYFFAAAAFLFAMWLKSLT